MIRIPFLKPNLVPSESYKAYLDSIDQNNIYSNFGPLNSLFEHRIVDEWFDGIGAASTVANATLGLITAVSNGKRAKGRFALMPSFTFAATPLAAMWCGLEPYFVDIREGDLCMDTDLLRETVEKLGDDVAVVVPYAAFGTNIDLSVYRSLQESGIPVIVDAAASFGAHGPQGQFGKGFPGAVIFSFHATKTFGIGEGGMVYSNESSLVDEVRLLSNFGFSEERVSVAMGLNAKLSEYAAAVGLATLDIFPKKVSRRQEIHGWYLKLFQNSGLFDRGWEVQKYEGSVPFQFMTVLCPEGQTNTDYMAELSRSNIESRAYFAPSCHQQPRFESAARTTMTVTERISRRVISLPMWDAITEDLTQMVVENLSGQWHRG